MTLREMEAAFEKTTRDAAARFEAMAPLGWTTRSRGQVVCSHFAAVCGWSVGHSLSPVWEVRPNNGLCIYGTGFTPEEAWQHFMTEARLEAERQYEPYRQVKEVLDWAEVKS